MKSRGNSQNYVSGRTIPRNPPSLPQKYVMVKTGETTIYSCPAKNVPILKYNYSTILMGKAADAYLWHQPYSSLIVDCARKIALYHDGPKHRTKPK